MQTDGRKTLRGHIERPQPDIVEASISAEMIADILGLIGVAPSDGSTAMRKRFVRWTVQRSGYPTVKVVIGGYRANQLRAQSWEPLDCWLDLDHTSAHKKRCAHVGTPDGLREKGMKGSLVPLLFPL